MRGNDGLSVHGFDVGAEVIGIKGGIAQHPFGRQAIDQRLGLGDIVALARREDEAYWQAEAAHGQMDFAGQAAARAANRLILNPPFAPAACW